MFKILASNVSVGNATVPGHALLSGADGTLSIGREDGSTTDSIRLKGTVTISNNLTLQSLQTNRALVINSNGEVGTSNVTVTQLNDLVGATGNISSNVATIFSNLNTLSSDYTARTNIVTVTTDTSTYTLNIDCSKGTFFNWDERSYIRNGNYLGASVVGFSSASDAADITLNLPDIEYKYGDIILVGFGDNASTVPSIHSNHGFTTIYNSTRYLLAYKVYTGSLDTSIVYYGTGATAAFSLVIRGATSTGLVTGLANSSSGQPNPPSITPNPKEAMYVACGFLQNQNVKSSVQAPANYTLQTANQASNTGFTVMCATRLGNTITTEDPSAFTAGSGLTSWWAMTLAFPSYGKINVLYSNATPNKVYDMRLKMSCNTNVVPVFLGSGNVYWSERSNDIDIGRQYNYMNVSNTYVVNALTINGGSDWYQDISSYKIA